MASGFLGYNFASPILGSVIPQRLQNLCIRDYASQKKLTLSFTVSEYFDHRRALMLFAQFDHGVAVSGFIFYSLTLLPSDNALRERFFARVTEKKLEVHFALEDLKLGAGADSKAIERLHQIRIDPRLDDTRDALLRLRGARG